MGENNLGDNMSTTLYYILGTSDICINDQTRIPNYYVLCEEIDKALQDDNSFKPAKGKCIFSKPINVDIEQNNRTMQKESVKELTFPLLDAILLNIKPKANRIIFFATRQKPPFKTDTFWAAQLIKRYLALAFQNISVTIEEINDDPSDHDKMITFFTQYRMKHSNELKYSLNNYFYLSPGAPPAVNAFSLVASDLDFKYYYLPRGKQVIQEVQAFSQFNQNKYKDILIGLTSCFQFKGSLAFVENSPYRNNRKLISLLTALQYRFDFKFRQSLEYAKKFSDDAALYNHFDSVSEIIQNNASAYAKEMIAHIEIEIEQGKLYLALAFLFNLLENVRQYLLKKYLDIELIPDAEQNGKFPQWEKYINECKHINDNERENYINYGPSRKNVLKLLRLINKKELSNSELLKITDFICTIENKQANIAPFGNISLQDLRNKGPVAHGVHGPDDQILDLLWPPFGVKGFLIDLKSFYHLLFDQKIGENEIKRLCSLIAAML